MMSYVKPSSMTRNSNSSGFSITFCLINFFASIIFHCLQFSIATTTSNSNGNGAGDKMVLLAIKAGISHDPIGVMRSWSSNHTLHFCKWHGITCGRRHQRVTGLSLQTSKLEGTLSPCIGNLSFLRSLDLSNNNFMGTIPPEIGRLPRLQHLQLSNNSFEGKVPSNISACSSLISLELRGNKLVGQIPPELGSLSMLRYLSLFDNRLTGTVPSSLGNLSSLLKLSLATNELDGKIPDSLGRFKNLFFLSLGVNKLSSIVPLSIFNMSSLVELELGENYLQGMLPLDLGTKLERIRKFSVFSNRFTGSIPTLSNFSNLQLLQLGRNYLHGQVPRLQNVENLTVFSIYHNSLGTGNEGDDLNFVSSLANATMLSTFDISENNLTGKFPELLCNFTMMKLLNLGLSNIVGEVPNCIKNLDHLHILDMSNNLLFGAIPSSIGMLQKLGILHLANNQLSGFIPTTIGNMTQLYRLSLSQNNLQGKIPSTLGNCGNLIELDLSANNLTGSIPSQIFSLSTLSVTLDLSNNNLIGPVPAKVWDIRNLNELALNNNMLSGGIPTALGTCLELQMLYLDGNLFQGSIPVTLMTLKGLLVLDLSRNNLSGNIPRFLGSINLKLLNLSFNNFEGQVPTGGIFSSSTNFSVLGNKRLCGGKPELKLPRCDLSKTSTINRKKKLIVIITSSLCGIILFVVVVSLYKFSHGKKNQASSAAGDLENVAFTHLSYQSLFKATNGFAINNLIGSGTFGLVYKGALDDDQTIVAVKKFNLEQKAAFKSFMAECGALQNIRHRNLVKVVTACSGIDYQGNDFKALVYEYMENGSLQDWLHPKPLVNVMGAPRILNLYQRFNIATDIAFALEYLHHQCGNPIVHCDLKPSNVLLDSEMIARVGDFGLAKFLSRSDILVPHGNQSSSMGLRGTVGYTAPEYGMGNEVSTQGDVYSFGILLLELFTGKMPVDNMFKEGLNLRKYVIAALPDQITDILDHHLREGLLGPEDSRGAVTHERSSSKDTNRSIMLGSLISVLEIAIICSEENPQERLDMSDVVSKLSSIKSKLLGTHLQQQKRNFGGIQG